MGHLTRSLRLISRRWTLSSIPATSTIGISSTKWGNIANPVPSLVQVFRSQQFFSSDASSAKGPPPLEKDVLEKMVKKSKVVVFMKGVPDAPKCGFSNAVVQILRMHGVEKYDAHNVLENEGIRQGIKEYTSWPTIPQIFINGEFVGGCDIMIQMHQSGDLVKELEKAGIKSALAEDTNTAT